MLTQLLPVIIPLSWGASRNGKNYKAFSEKGVVLHLPFKGYLIVFIFLKKKNLAKTCNVLTEIGTVQSGNGKQEREKQQVMTLKGICIHSSAFQTHKE